MSKKVLITDHVHDHLIQQLKKNNFQVHYLPNISYKAFQAVLSNYNGVVINSKIKMTAEIIRKHPSLDFIARLGSGLDIIDLEAAAEYNVRVFAAPEGNRNAVAEHAVGMLLSLENNLCRANYTVKNFEWQREVNRGSEIESRKIGIVGFGNTGRSFAEKWAGWNVEILAYDKYKTDYASELNFVRETTLNSILNECDVISFHLPLTEETHMMVNKKLLKNCKKGTIIINTSRGKILKTADLYNYLANGHLKGACLDVLENEDFSRLSTEERSTYEALFKLENVILSPHVAGWTHASLFKIADVLADKIVTNKS